LLKTVGKMSATASPDDPSPHHPRRKAEDRDQTAAAAAKPQKSPSSYGHTQEVGSLPDRAGLHGG
ncbi:hypothetical protein XENOCAPTIV_008697, partial [Xenoophorus captivus]